MSKDPIHYIILCNRYETANLHFDLEIKRVRPGLSKLCGRDVRHGNTIDTRQRRAQVEPTSSFRSSSLTRVYRVYQSIEI